MVLGCRNETGIGTMFRLLRTLILLVAAFGAGMLYERAHQIDLCEASGGQWMRAGFCAAEG